MKLKKLSLSTDNLIINTETICSMYVSKYPKKENYHRIIRFIDGDILMLDGDKPFESKASALIALNDLFKEMEEK